MPPFLTCIHISGWTIIIRGRIQYRTPVELPLCQYATTLLADMCTHHEKNRHHIGAGDSLLHTGIVGARDMGQHSMAAMGIQIQDEDLPIKQSGK